MNIHGAHSYWKQGALGAAGVKRVWAGAGPHRAQGRGHIARLPAQLVLEAIRSCCTTVTSHKYPTALLLMTIDLDALDTPGATEKLCMADISARTAISPRHK